MGKRVFLKAGLGLGLGLAGRVPAQDDAARATPNASRARHPGWPNRKSPTSGRIFRIELA